MKRSKFSLSHYKLMSTFLGDLFPITWFEVLPGDTIQQSSTMLVRSAPIVVPIMHPLHVSIHHWFVPNRLIWTGAQGAAGETTGGWENFITGGPNGMDATTHPYITIAGNATVDTLSDYLGIPTENYSGSSYTVSALPFRAYQLIWNEFYRDQDLQGYAALVTTDGADTTTSTAVAEVTWEKDYLTTARPWEAKGPSVGIPQGGNAQVYGIGFPQSGQTNTAGQAVNDGVLGATTYAHALGTTANEIWFQANAAGTAEFPSVFADLATATGPDINTLRHAFAIQRFEEARARYGSRYVEYLRYLGVRSADARLQRPEYLGGGRSTMQFSEVLQTGVSTSGGSAGGAGGVGQYGGHGITALRSNRYRRFFQEHGIVMTLAFVRPKGIYTQPVERKWLRGMASTDGLLGTKEDYWQRELQHIGQQQVNGLEVDASCGNSVFGYQDRYDEYRRIPSTVSGQFRATGGGERLDMWNMAREFGSAPSLNAAFVACLPSNRGYADLVGPQLYIMANHSIQARRLVARTGTSYVR